MATNFGALLQQIRAERGVTQAQLAARAGTSISTVQRAESSAKCPLRRSTALNIFRALDSVHRIEPATAKLYMTAAGLSVGIASTSSSRANPSLAQAQAIMAVDRLLPEDGTREAHRLFWDLIDEAGIGSVLQVLRGLAGAAGGKAIPAKRKPE